MNCSIASSRVKEDDYSEITERIMGKKTKFVLNIFIIVYSYACLITFFVINICIIWKIYSKCRISK